MFFLQLRIPATGKHLFFNFVGKCPKKVYDCLRMVPPHGQSLLPQVCTTWFCLHRLFTPKGTVVVVCLSVCSVRGFRISPISTRNGIPTRKQGGNVY